jgi:exopolysaccharide biosynthesis protein
MTTIVKQSKKVKHSPINKTQLWNIFDNEIVNENKITVPLECIYGSSGREMCERCESSLAFSDEGFLTCTNSKCGIIYKDISIYDVCYYTPKSQTDYKSTYPFFCC